MSNKQSKTSLKYTALGGLHEIGKAMHLFELSNKQKPEETEYLIVDAGLKYYGDDDPSIDYGVADYRFLCKEDKVDKIKALLITNTHEHHAGAATHIIEKLHLKKVYGSKVALEMIRLDLPDKLVDKIEWVDFETGISLHIGGFEVVPFHITSPYSDSYALMVNAAGNKVFYTSSYKLDQSPVDKRKFDLGHFFEYIDYKTEMDRRFDLFIACSANVEVEGYSKSELELIEPLTKIVKTAPGRIFFNTYNCNFLRLQTMVKIALKHGRKIALFNYHVRRSFKVMRNLGMLEVPDDLFIDIFDTENYDDDKVLILSSAPEMQAIDSLKALAFDRSAEASLKAGDTVVNSADLPPGTVRMMAQIADQLFLKKVKLIGGRNAGINVESYALTEEMKFMFNVVKSRYLIPAIGETRHLVQHAKLAVEASFDPGSILILENGDKVEFDGDILRVVDQVDNKEIYFSSSVHYEVSGEVIDERDLMSREGIVVITFTIDKKNKIIAGPIFNSKACTFSKNREWRAFCMMNTQPIIDSVEELFTHNPNTNLNECEKVVKNYMEKIIRQQIGKRPTLLVHADKVGA